MGIRLRTAHAGKVLPATLDAAPAEVGGIHPGVGNHVLGIVSPTASGEGVGGAGIVADVQHRGKVHVHAQAAEGQRRHGSQLHHAGKITVPRQGRRGRQVQTESGRPHHPAPFLVHGDDGMVIAQFP